MLPDYVWHVISIPRRSDDDRRVDGAIVHSEKVPDHLDQIQYSINSPQPRLTATNLEWHKRQSSVVYVNSRGRRSRIPTFNRADAAEARDRVTGIWQTLFGVDSFDTWIGRLQEEKTANGDLYLHTFYFWPIDKLLALGPHALKEASSKRVQSSGRIFGFLMHPNGTCLAFDYVDIGP